MQEHDDDQEENLVAVAAAAWACSLQTESVTDDNDVGVDEGGDDVVHEHDDDEGEDLIAEAGAGADHLLTDTGIVYDDEAMEQRMGGVYKSDEEEEGDLVAVAAAGGGHNVTDAITATGIC